jgi:hypothetical protein
MRVGRVAAVVTMFAVLGGCGDQGFAATSDDLVTRPFVAAHRSLEVVARGTTVTLVERDGSQRSVVGSFRTELPVATVDAIANGDDAEIVLLTCAAPHRRDDDDLHEACDGPSSLDHVRVAGGDGRVLHREQITPDEELEALQLAGDRPVVHSAGSRAASIRILDGDQWVRWNPSASVPRSSTHVCLTDEGGYALQGPAPPTTTVPVAGPASFPTGTALWFHPLTGEGEWKPVALPEGVRAGTELWCTPSHVLLTTSTATPGQDGLFVGRGGTQLDGATYAMQGAVLTQQRSYDTNEFPVVQSLTPSGATRTLILDPRRDLAPYSDTSSSTGGTAELRAYHGLVDGELVALRGRSG